MPPFLSTSVVEWNPAKELLVLRQPNQQWTLNKLPTELRRRKILLLKHRLSIQICAKRAKTCVQMCIYSN